MSDVRRNGGQDLAALLWSLVTGGCAVVGIVALASCTPAQLQQAQLDIGLGIQAACLDVMAVAAVPGVDPNLKPFATASCGTASAVGALVQSSATLQWLGKLQGELATTTRPVV